jgi:hypothetical protein
MRFCALLTACILLLAAAPVPAQDTVVIRPREIDDVLVNPGIGFMTFQRFNGDKLNEGTKWTEGYPIEYQEYKGSLENKDHPMTSMAYFRIYWKFIEPEQGKYKWELIDTALKTARNRKQTLLLRIAPYGTEATNDVPDWYRAMAGDETGKLPVRKWRTNPEDPRYVRHFGGMIRELGGRYDAHPDLESVDLSIVGAWGEGDSSNLLSQGTRQALIDCYVETFRRTPLLMLLTDEKTNGYALSRRAVGWRVDCLGDMGGFSPTWSHMTDYYPEGIIRFGARDAWKQAPVSFEVCWVMQHWKDKGWDVDYIIDQSLKWHISSFNSKSSPVPAEWKPNVDRWLKKMGYRFVLRKFAFPAAVKSPGVFPIDSWWENKGVAPCYRRYPVAVRISGGKVSTVLTTSADITSWMPGDSLFDERLTLPAGIPPGEYDLDIALLDPASMEPRVNLAIAGRKVDGWYTLGKIKVQQ